jgi:hypothetical protein
LGEDISAPARLDGLTGGKNPILFHSGSIPILESLIYSVIQGLKPVF